MQGRMNLLKRGSISSVFEALPIKHCVGLDDEPQPSIFHSTVKSGALGFGFDLTQTRHLIIRSEGSWRISSEISR